MEATVKERVIRFLQNKKIATSVFERSIGVSNGYMRQLRNSPKPAVLERIFEAYPQINRAWLLAGIGDMCVAEGETPQPTESTPAEAPEEEPHESEISRLMNMIESLIEQSRQQTRIAEMNARANEINAEANKRNADNLAKLIAKYTAMHGNYLTQEQAAGQPRLHK